MALFALGLIAVVVGIGLFINRNTRIPIKGGLQTVAVGKFAPIPIALGLALLVGSSVRVVAATNVGIPVTLGKIGSPLDAGVHFTLPWTEVTTFSTRFQESLMTKDSTEGDRPVNDQVTILSSEGGRLDLDVTVRYAIDPAQASLLFKRVGSMTGIRDRIVRPDARSRIRDVYSRYTAEQAYSQRREFVGSEAEKAVRAALAPKGITLDALRIRDITLEPALQKEISAKLEAKQAVERALIEQQRDKTKADTRLKVATIDATARVASAKGEAEANKILNSSLTPELLRAREIEAIKGNPNTILYPFGQPITPLISAGSKGVTPSDPTAETTTTVAAP